MSDPFAEAHARADRLARLFGSTAAQPETGEPVVDYRRRLAARFQRRALDPAIRDVALRYVPAAAFDQIERQIYDQAEEFGRSAASAPPGKLRAIASDDQSGRAITEFVGDPNAWMNAFAMPLRRVVRFRCSTSLNAKLRR